jgi:membrane-bound serine protease (ClpP class)
MGLVGRVFFAVVALGLGLGGWSGARAQETLTRPVMLAQIDGVIGPPTALHVKSALKQAGERGAEALILEINTPGGLVDSMRDIVNAISLSPVPVIGFVAPSGSRAASAGTYIMYATNVAAMAPGTNIGAATPVNLGPGGASDEKGKADETKDQPDTALERKAVNDAAALIRSLAEQHGRNAAWGEEAVRGGAALSAREALEAHVIELMATDIDDLMDKLDGRVIEFGGVERRLVLRGRTLERIEMSPMTELLGVLSNPNVAFLLMMIGFYGLIYEFLNPGVVLPGVVGAVCLVLGLFALNQLPLDYAGLALIILGIGFIITEAFTPSFGLLGVTGVVAFLIGAGMLIDTDIPEYQLSWPVIVAFAALTGGFAAIAIGFAAKSMRRKHASGNEALIGQSARVLDWTGGAGHVWALGERWSAEGPADLRDGQTVSIESVASLRLRVRAKAAQGEST